MNLRARLDRLKRLQPAPTHLIGRDGMTLVRVLVPDEDGTPPEGVRAITAAEAREYHRLFIPSDDDRPIPSEPAY